MYDFDTGVWTDLPKTPSGYDVDQLLALTLSDTQILLVGGRWPGIDYTKENYIYDTEAKQYIHAGDRQTGYDGGFNKMGCAVIPGGAKVICAGGTHNLRGKTKR